MRKYETIIIWIVGIADLLKRVYIKTFPPIAVIFAAVCVIYIPDGVANGKLQGEHIPYLFAAAAMFTSCVAVWFVLTAKEKAQQRRVRYK